MNKMNGDLKIEVDEVVELVKAEALRRLAESGLRGVTLRSIQPQKVKKHFDHPYDHRQSGDAEVDDGFLVYFECPCDKGRSWLGALLHRVFEWWTRKTVGSDHP